MKIVKNIISIEELADIAKNQFGDFVKAVVDINKGIMVIGGELHADEESLLIAEGSKQENIWGINLYPEKALSEWIEFDSIINIRPSQNNRSRYVEDQLIRDKIIEIVNKLIKR